MTKKSKGDKSGKDANRDKDSIDRLPLSTLPLSSNILKGATLVKNARMETAVEILRDPLSGNLHVSPNAIADFMEASPRDRALITSLANLHSFDVYSLRNSLKRLGVEVVDAETLELSEDMKTALSSYSLEFIRPLIEKIFGQGREDLHTTQGLNSLFKDSDLARVRENLRQIADKTGIPLSDIPEFLEEYSDVFLSVAYYRYSFESIGPDIDRFLFWIYELQSHRDVSSSPKTTAQCKQVGETVRFLANSIRERLAQFQVSFEMFWADMNRASFRQMRKQIEENHSSMGAVLCGLVVKVNLWKREFPDNSVGGPSTRIKFVITEMEPGLNQLKELEHEARKRLGMIPIRI